MNKTLVFIILYVILLIYQEKRFNWSCPTITIYPNNEREIIEVKKYVEQRTQKDIDFFQLTDIFVSNAFVDHVPDTKEELDKLVNGKILLIISIYKYLINRARPYQIDTKLNTLSSQTAHTPGYPSGHAFQAYYLAKKLGQKYPEKKEQLIDIANECAKVRVIGGVHFPSDINYAQELVDKFFK